MKSARATSKFGTRRDPITHREAMHHGMDFAGPHRAKVFSTADGEVVKAGKYGAYGKFVEIKHRNGLRTRYGHLHKILTRRGQKIKRGEVIGLQGNTGRLTGSHLHYEVRYNKKPLDPNKFIKAGEYVL